MTASSKSWARPCRPPRGHQLADHRCCRWPPSPGLLAIRPPRRRSQERCSPSPGGRRDRRRGPARRGADRQRAERPADADRARLFDLIGQLLPAAAGVALMSFVESIAAGRAIATPTSGARRRPRTAGPRGGLPRRWRPAAPCRPAAGCPRRRSTTARAGGRSSRARSPAWVGAHSSSSSPAYSPISPRRRRRAGARERDRPGRARAAQPDPRHPPLGLLARAA